MTRLVAYTVCSCALSIALVACNAKEDQGSEFATGVPRASTVAMAVPSSEAKALTVEGSTKALEGQTAEWYATTRNVTVT